jgi:FG-GAP-like repeat
MRARELGGLLWCGALVGCFHPSIQDGAVACGDAGCPPGMVCTAEQVCRPTGGDATDLVLATARGGVPAQLFAYCDGAIPLAWQLDNVIGARSVAWADGPAGSHQLAIGSLGDVFRLFTLSSDLLQLQLSFDGLTQGRGVGWADYDGDGKLDLAISDGDYSLKVFRNDVSDGLQQSWRADDMSDPWGLAWGDYDGDGVEDLAVASATTVNVYRYDPSGGGGGGGGGGGWGGHGGGSGSGTGPSFTRVWSSPITEETRAVAWADVDSDGDLDLFSGADGGPVREYRNDGNGAFTQAWASDDVGQTPGLSFGDYDGDGDLDLAVAGRDRPSHVFRNDHGALTLAWSTPASQTTWSVQWFDVDGDGDLDLTLGNYDEPSRVYRNDAGTLVDWLTIAADHVRALAWSRWPVQAAHPSACDVARWRALPPL